MRDENSCADDIRLKTSIDELVKFFQLPASFTFFEPPYNIAPTQPVLAIREVMTGDAENSAMKRQPAYFTWDSCHPGASTPTKARNC